MISEKIIQIINALGIIDNKLEEKFKGTLTERGLNSFGFITLVVEIEKEFGIEVQEEDLIIEKFDSIQNIEEYINNAKKRKEVID